MKKKLNSKILIGVFSILLAVIALVTSTYAVFFHEDTASNLSSYETGYLAITAKSKTDTISLNYTVPKQDEEGKKTDPYIFTITNIGNLDYKFDVKLLSTTTENNINSQYIKLQIDDEEPTILSALTLKAGESIDISIRVWLDWSTPNS